MIQGHGGGKRPYIGTVRLRLSMWQPWQLLMAWSAYWLALALWGIGSALPIIWRVTRPESHGSTSLSFGSGAFHFIVVEGTKTVWHGDVAFQTLAERSGIEIERFALEWAGQARSVDASETRRAASAGTTLAMSAMVPSEPAAISNTVASVG